ncbi:MAG: LacI family DNA-binding transcriptional regulator [Pseudomonadota bacterium]
MPANKPKKRANLRDVASKAGVSVATVSRVLNTPDIVQKKTRARVEHAIAALNFHPSAAARAINSGRTRIIGALVPTLDNDIFAQTLDAIEQRLRDFGFSLVVATTAEDPEVEASRAKELIDIGVEGLILSGTSHSSALVALLERTRVQAVAISYFDPTYRYPTIGYDNLDAARLAMDHLVGLGHRRIAVIHSPAAHNDRTRARIHGATTPREDVTTACFEAALSVAGGCAIVDHILRETPLFDAFLCTTDVLAYGVMFELQRRGFNVPGDVSVMGLHDLPSAREMVPRLSTVRLPARQMGRRAAEALAQWVEDDVKPEPQCFACALKDRESTQARRR